MDLGLCLHLGFGFGLDRPRLGLRLRLMLGWGVVGSVQVATPDSVYEEGEGVDQFRLRFRLRLRLRLTDGLLVVVLGKGCVCPVKGSKVLHHQLPSIDCLRVRVSPGLGSSLMHK